jgi:hypothetical protein
MFPSSSTFFFNILNLEQASKKLSPAVKAGRIALMLIRFASESYHGREGTSSAKTLKFISQNTQLRFADHRSETCLILGPHEYYSFPQKCHGNHPSLFSSIRAIFDVSTQNERSNRRVTVIERGSGLLIFVSICQNLKPSIESSRK